jgi:hypothetical protein
MRILGLVIAGAILTAAGPAAAERWYAVGGNDEGWTYVDADSMESRGGLRYAKSYTRYASPLFDEVYAGTIISEFDCANNWFRTLEYSYYGAAREHIGTEASETIDQRREIEAGSINEAIFGFVCFGRSRESVIDPWEHAGRMLGTAPAGK